MSISVPLQNNAINVADLEKLAKSNPQYTKLFLGLTQIDAFVKQVCGGVVCTSADPNSYSIKTEISSLSYSLYLFNSERNAIVGCTWPITSFLIMCQSKTIETDVINQTKKIMDKFQDAELCQSPKVNWIN